MAVKFFSINNISALQAFQTFRFLAAILISIILVKSGLEVREISFYEILFFLGNFVSLFWVQGMKNGLLSFYPNRSPEEQKRLIFNLFVIFLLLGLVSSSVLWFLKDFITAHLTSYSEIPHIGLICIFVVFNTPTILIEFTYLLGDESKSILKYGGIIFSLQLLLITGGVLFFDGIAILIKLMIIWAFVKLLWLIVVLMRKAQFRLDLNLQKRFVLFSFPLVIHLLLGNAMEYVDGFIVSRFFEEEKFAIFRYGARELPITLILVGALVSAIIPPLVKDFDNSLRILKQKVSALIKWLFPLSIILMLISPLIYPLVYSQDYIQSARIFNLYLLILGSRIILAQTVVYAKHDNKILAYFAGLELILNLGLSIWWAQLFGLEGIVYATIVAFFFFKIMLVSYNYFKYQISVNRYLDLKYYLGFNILLVGAYFISLQY